MHTNEDIWEIRQIVIGKGMRVAKEVKEAKEAKEMKEATMGMMVTRGPATTAVMELVATMAKGVPGSECQTGPRLVGCCWRLEKKNWTSSIFLLSEARLSTNDDGISIIYYIEL
jgi:hypothetical protein